MAVGTKDPGQQSLMCRSFTGNEDGLNHEFVYSLAGSTDASSQYSKTTKGITKYKNGGDVEHSLSEGVKFVMIWPPAPTVTVTAAAVAGDPHVVTPSTNSGRHDDNLEDASTDGFTAPRPSGQQPGELLPACDRPMQQGNPGES